MQAKHMLIPTRLASPAPIERILAHCRNVGDRFAFQPIIRGGRRGARRISPSTATVSAAWGVGSRPYLAPGFQAIRKLAIVHAGSAVNRGMSVQIGDG
jgi:hypothetical protein